MLVLSTLYTVLKCYCNTDTANVATLQESLIEQPVITSSPVTLRPTGISERSFSTLCSQKLSEDSNKINFLLSFS